MGVKIALAGNPNSGKTTLFNALTGSNQFVGNWPGVTVEKKEGKWKEDKKVVIMDLPGIYSLSPYTLEEVVARNYLITERPDAILNIVDGTNLERNLYLTTQLLELGIPVVMAINMMDIVRKNGDEINTKKLAEKLGCEVVTISALKGDGIKDAASRAVKHAGQKAGQESVHEFAPEVENYLNEIEGRLGYEIPEEQKRFYAIKLFERDDKIKDAMKNAPDVEDIIARAEKEMDDDAESIITNERYSFIGSIIGDCLKKNKTQELTTSDKIDRIVTNRWLALPIFAAVMWLVYYVSVTTVGSILTDWTNDTLFGEWIIPAAQSFFEGIGCADWLTGLIVDGVISGVGAVLGFVPQMLVLFIFLAFLESCGYMARIAFIMDRIFRKFGLSGKSFIPMLIGTGCGVPGVMASRTIENDRDRKMTVMTTTFIPCGAKLPIIALIAGALFDGASWVAPSAYFVGIAAIICSGIILKKTKMFAGDPAPFVMELPAYHMPTVGNVLRSMWERGWSFIKKAGTIITLSTIIVWFLLNFGWTDAGFGMLNFDGLEGAAMEAAQAQCILAKIGNLIAWIFAPLGWGNWKMTVAAITGLVAKENVVGTFGQLFGFAEVAEDGQEIWGTLANSMSQVAAYSFLVFNLLCAPCFAAMGAIKREMNNAKWFWFAIGYQCLLAYLVALCIFQFGTLFTGGGFGIGTVAAIVILIGFIYMLFRPYKESTSLNANTVSSVRAAAK
ncbi:ferrous iron transport protein B [Dorea formicigenerans]|jgi:ferrous iron transport protein B|uniref:Ferrous iron transport protein B n=1 Tax=Dorea formicigenerans TaxID=39486 RepID=A0A3E4F8R1_9FIRM|nr:ferrous iron transport protein B [Dorea formicigenerans]RGI85809.1 ferrous iron transport protein B [Dorea formicigenerans]RGI88989.1 ferrous iron transport protein B [Dorea formicigenerans]